MKNRCKGCKNEEGTGTVGEFVKTFPVVLIVHEKDTRPVCSLQCAVNLLNLDAGLLGLKRCEGCGAILHESDQVKYCGSIYCDGCADEAKDGDRAMEDDDTFSALDYPE